MCVKFQVPSFHTFGDMLRTKIPEKKNVQRAMTSEILKIEQWFLYTAHLLNEIYPLVKFEVDISNTFGDMLRTKMWDGRMDGRKDGQRR